jgi:hypothetical protein
MATIDEANQWWWDLRRGKAVRDADRGKADDMLGPYPSEAAAQNWQETRDEREAAWKADDDEE